MLIIASSSDWGGEKEEAEGKDKLLLFGGSGYLSETEDNIKTDTIPIFLLVSCFSFCLSLERWYSYHCILVCAQSGTNVLHCSRSSGWSFRSLFISLFSPFFSSTFPLLFFFSLLLSFFSGLSLCSISTQLLSLFFLCSLQLAPPRHVRAEIVALLCCVFFRTFLFSSVFSLLQRVCVPPFSLSTFSPLCAIASSFQFFSSYLPYCP